MTQIMSESINAGLPKNEGCTRNFLGRGSVPLHQPRTSRINIPTEPQGIKQGSRKMRVVPEFFWEEGACRSTNPEQVG